MTKIKSAHFYPLARGILASSSLTARRLFLGVPASIISTNSVKKSLISGKKKLSRHPLTLPITTSDQDIISPHNIHTIESRQVMRIKENINKQIII